MQRVSMSDNCRNEKVGPTALRSLRGSETTKAGSTWAIDAAHIILADQLCSINIDVNTSTTHLCLYAARGH